MDSYGEICAAFYDLDKPFAPALALEWYAEELTRHLGGTDSPADPAQAGMPGAKRIFEPMCGSGRFLVPLLQRGFEIDGADPSAPMLQRCREKLANAGEPDYAPQLFEQSMQQMDVPGQYAGAFIPSSSFCLITDPAQAREALTRLRRHLQPGALLLIEFELPHPEINWPGEASKTVTKGGTQIRLVSRVTYDFASQLEHYRNEYELKQSGKVVASESEELQLRCYAPDEFRRLLEDSGYSSIEIEHPDFGWVAKARA